MRYHVITEAEAPVTARHQVILFLTLMKDAAGRRFVLTQRKTNLEALALLGLSLTDVKERILGLTPDEYVSGPSPDGKRLGDEVWVFGLQISEQEIYVKVCVITEPLLCTCISFHVAGKAMVYPLRAAAK
jgi:hypothetical protein